VSLRRPSADLLLAVPLCALVLGAGSCRTTGAGSGGAGVGQPQGSTADSSGEAYFDPLQCSLSGLVCLPDKPRRNPFRWAFVDVRLAELGEPSLRAVAREGGESYRAVVATSFDGTAVARLDVDPAGGGELVLWNPDGYCTNLAIRRTEPHTTPLSQAQVEGLVAGIEMAGFWTVGLKGGASGLDGTDWYLEGARGGTHRLVHRFTPGEPLRAVAESFTAAAGCLHRPLD